MSKWNKKTSYVENDNDSEYGSEGEEENEVEIKEPISIPVRICLWEFGQNDPKRYINNAVHIMLISL